MMSKKQPHAFSFIKYIFFSDFSELPVTMGEDLQMKCLLELYGLKVTTKPYHLLVILSVINFFSFNKEVMSLIFIHSVMHSCPRLSSNCCLMCILCFSSVTCHGKKLV